MTTPMDNEERIRKLEERVAALEELLAPEEPADRIQAPPSPSGRWRVEARIVLIGGASSWEPLGEFENPDEAEVIANLDEERRIVPVPIPGAN